MAVIFSDSIRINYKGSVEDEFGKGNSIELITNYLFSHLPVKIKDSSILSKVTLDLCEDKSLLKQRKLKYKGSKLSVHVPDTGITLPLLKGETDYVLILDSMSITSDVNIMPIMVGLIPVAGIPFKPLIYKAKFVIWDNKKGGIVAYGKNRVSLSKGVVVTKDIWNKVTQLFASKILRDTPFYRKIEEEKPVTPKKKSLHR